jgi:hypothetical protein
VRKEDEAVGRLVEKAREDLWGEPMDVEEGSVGLPGTLPFPWVGGSWALWGAFGRFWVGEDGAGCDGGGVGAAVARAKAAERRGLRRRGGPAVPSGVGTPAVPAGSGAPAVPGGMEGGDSRGEKGGRGRGTFAVRAGRN